MNAVLVMGVALSNKPTLCHAIEAELYRSKNWAVHQHWTLTDQAAKFRYFNDMAATHDLSTYRYIICVDDDISLPEGFLDSYLERVEDYHFALCQPARTPNSTGSHKFVFQYPLLDARQTRFIECGPLFSIRADAVRLLIPFDLSVHGMGAGRDFCWPLTLDAHGLTLGIIDSTPIEHTFREPGTTYNRSQTNLAMRQYLEAHAHLTSKDAFVNVHTYPKG